MVGGGRAAGARSEPADGSIPPFDERIQRTLVDGPIGSGCGVDDRGSQDHVVDVRLYLDELLDDLRRPPVQLPVEPLEVCEHGGLVGGEAISVGDQVSDLGVELAKVGGCGVGELGDEGEQAGEVGREPGVVAGAHVESDGAELVIDAWQKARGQPASRGQAGGEHLADAAVRGHPDWGDLVQERALVELVESLSLGCVVSAVERSVISEVVEGNGSCIAVDVELAGDVSRAELQPEPVSSIDGGFHDGDVELGVRSDRVGNSRQEPVERG